MTVVPSAQKEDQQQKSSLFGHPADRSHSVEAKHEKRTVITDNFLVTVGDGLVKQSK
jgi:hypothetical protein